MTRHTVVGDLLFPMTVHAPTHRLIDHTLSGCHVGNVSVTGDALHFVASNMWRVIEANMRHRRKPVDALPGNIFTTIKESGELLNFRHPQPNPAEHLAGDLPFPGGEENTIAFRDF